MVAYVTEEQDAKAKAALARSFLEWRAKREREHQKREWAQVEGEPYQTARAFGFLFGVVPAFLFGCGWVLKRRGVGR